LQLSRAPIRNLSFQLFFFVEISGPRFFQGGWCSPRSFWPRGASFPYSTNFHHGSPRGYYFFSRREKSASHLSGGEMRSTVAGVRGRRPRENFEVFMCQNRFFQGKISIFPTVPIRSSSQPTFGCSHSRKAAACLCSTCTLQLAHFAYSKDRASGTTHCTRLSRACAQPCAKGAQLNERQQGCCGGEG
jgi:hypothetical protein